MNTISFAWFVAILIQVALCAPAAEETYETPTGPMDLEELTAHYVQQRFHRYDDKVEGAQTLVKTWIKKLDTFIDDAENPEAEIDACKEIKGYFENFLADTENESLVHECSLQMIGHYYQHRIQDLAKKYAEYENIKNLFASLKDDYNNAVGEEIKGDAVYSFVQKDEHLKNKVVANAKIDAVCCKYYKPSSHKVYMHDIC